jgi:hypothetical protein
MTDLLGYLADISALAFLALALATATGWLRRRDSSLGWLALAIVLLSPVSLTGRVAALIKLSSPVVTEITVLALVGSAYALLRYRGSLIPLPRTAMPIPVSATDSSTLPACWSRRALVSCRRPGARRRSSSRARCGPTWSSST